MPFNFGQDEESSYQSQLETRPVPTSYEEASQATQEESFLGTAVGLLTRNYALNELQNQTSARLSPEEANEKYPGMDVPFREPVSPYVAQYKHDQFMEKRQREEKILNGPSDVWSKTKMMGVGVLTHLLDPIETGANIMGGWAVGGAIKAGAFGSRAAAVAAQGARASFAARVGLGVAENATSELAFNTAQGLGEAITSAREGVEVDPIDILGDIAINTLAGTAFGVGVKELSHGISARMKPAKAFESGAEITDFLRDTSPEADLPIMRSAVSDVDSHRVPRINELTEALARETSVAPNGKFDYTFEKLPEVVPDGKRMYVAAHGADLKGGTFLPSERMGDGIHLTDNPGVANAAAARSMADGVGTVHEIDLTGMRLLDLDQPLPENVSAALKGLADEMGVDLQNTTGKDFMDFVQGFEKAEFVPEGTAKNVQNQLRELGYDGITHNGSTRNGVDHVSHNAIMLLDDTKASSKGFYSADPATRNTPSADLLTRAENNSSSFGQRFDIDEPAMERFVQEIRDMELNETSAVKSLKEHLETNTQRLQELNKQGLLDERALKELEGLTDLKTRLEDEHTLVKAAIYCVGD